MLVKTGGSLAGARPVPTAGFLGSIPGAAALRGDSSPGGSNTNAEPPLEVLQLRSEDQEQQTKQQQEEQHHEQLEG